EFLFARVPTYCRLRNEKGPPVTRWAFISNSLAPRLLDREVLQGNRERTVGRQRDAATGTGRIRRCSRCAEEVRARCSCTQLQRRTIATRFEAAATNRAAGRVHVEDRIEAGSRTRHGDRRRREASGDVDLPDGVVLG